MAPPSRQCEGCQTDSVPVVLLTILGLGNGNCKPFADGISRTRQGSLPRETGTDRAAHRGGGVSRAAAQLGEAAGIKSYRPENTEADTTCGFRDVHHWSHLDGAKRRRVGGARQLRGKAGMAFGSRPGLRHPWPFAPASRPHLTVTYMFYRALCFFLTPCGGGSRMMECVRV